MALECESGRWTTLSIRCGAEKRDADDQRTPIPSKE